MTEKLNVSAIDEEISLDSLEGVDVEQFKDLPEFRTFPDCLVIATPEVKVKPVKDQPAVIVTFTLKSVISYVDDNIEAQFKVNENDVTSVMFGLGAEIGQGTVKQFVKDFLTPKTGSTDLGINMKYLNALDEVKVLFKETKPNKEGKTFNRILSLDVE